MKVSKNHCFYAFITCMTLLFVQEARGNSPASNSWSENSVVEDRAIVGEPERFFYDLVVPSGPVKVSSCVSPAYFQQKLDHFNDFNDIMWTQRAFVNNKHEKNDGPVLLIVGGIKKIDPAELEHPSWLKLAEILHAPIYILEHRYYGESVPTDLSAKNLLYMRSKQALADIERFIKESDNSTRKWIVVGTGYGGTLAAWFRLKYPLVAIGALVVISPMLILTEDSSEYDIFTVSFDQIEKDIIQKAFTNLHLHIEMAKYAELKELFKMCSSLDEGNNKEDNVKFMFWSIITYLGQWKNSKILKNSLKDDTIKLPLDKVADAVIKIMNTYQETCLFVNYGEAIEKYKNINIIDENQINYPMPLKLGLGSLPNFYQHCTEYGMFLTSEDGKKTFGVTISLDFHIKLCEQTFGMKFNSEIYQKAIDTTNNCYGGNTIQATNLIYVTLEDSFWNRIGMAESNSSHIIKFNLEDLSNGNQLEAEYGFVTSKLNEWARENSIVVDNSDVGTTEK